MAHLRMARRSHNQSGMANERVSCIYHVIASFLRSILGIGLWEPLKQFFKKIIRLKETSDDSDPKDGGRILLTQTLSIGNEFLALLLK